MRRVILVAESASDSLSASARCLDRVVQLNFSKIKVLYVDAA